MRPSGTPQELEQRRLRAVRLLSEGFSRSRWHAKSVSTGAAFVAGRRRPVQGVSRQSLPNLLRGVRGA